jgi:hypothetical protein
MLRAEQALSIYINRSFEDGLDDEATSFVAVKKNSSIG